MPDGGITESAAELGSLNDIADLQAELDDRRNVVDEAETELRHVPIYNIESYGADLTAEQHAHRVHKGAYIVPPFQRSYIWSPIKASRFIESLLLGLPVPSIFLFKEHKDGKLLVVDGQQRLKTLAFFYKEAFAEGPAKDRTFRLSQVKENWDGKTYSQLSDDDRQRLDDAVIHTIIFRQNQPSDDYSSVFHVFERLNTGGMNLSAQEIRTCVAYGQFVIKLRELNKDENWRRIFGKESVRLKDQELILRFLALYDNGDNYQRPMNDFLNRFIMSYRNDAAALERFAALFRRTIACARKCLGDRAFRPEAALNAALYDACMVALARRLDRGGEPNPSCVKSRYDELVSDAKFQSFYRRATSDKESVLRRIEMATTAFETC